MPENLEGPSSKPPSSRSYAPLLIVEGFRTLRFAVVGAVVVGCVWAAAWCIKGIYSEEHTVWSVIAIVVTALFGTSAAPAALFAWAKQRFQAYIAIQQDRIRTLEIKENPSRTTSGLLEDGSHPNDI